MDNLVNLYQTYETHSGNGNIQPIKANPVKSEVYRDK